MRAIRYIAIALTAAVLISCGTAPVIQSSRIRGQASAGVAGGMQFHKIRPPQSDTAGNPGLGLVLPAIHTMPGIKIGERGEFSGIIIPLLLMNDWDFNVKLNILDKGDRSSLFRNVGLSLFGSSNGHLSIAGSLFWMNAAAGLAIGSSVKLGEHEIEFNLLPAGLYNWYWDADGEADPEVDVKINSKSASLGFNILWFPPLGRDLLELGMGVNYAWPIRQRITGEYKDHVILNPWIVQASLRIYFDIDLKKACGCLRFL